MRISRRFRLLACLVFGLALHGAPAGGGEPTPRQLLPPALAALGVSGDQVLGSGEAHRVRGSGVGIMPQGMVVRFAGTSRFDGGSLLTLAAIGGGERLRLSFGSAGFAFATSGTAVLIGDPAIRGALEARTGVFDGLVEFQGSTSSLSVVALPGSSAIDVR